MKETLIFKKVHDRDGKRFYKLSMPVTEAPNDIFKWQDEKDFILERIKDEFKPFMTDKIEYVCVSDASTHTERLLFSAIPADRKGKDYVVLIGTPMDGKWTMSIHGGNSRDVHPDEVYLRRLASANNYNFKMIKNKNQ